MTELTELEQLEKAVVDTEADFDTIYYNYAAWDAWVKAKLELEDCLKEQQDNG